MTRVTIGMPACESARTLARAIASVQAQTLTDWRLIVSDDASTDIGHGPALRQPLLACRAARRPATVVVTAHKSATAG